MMHCCSAFYLSLTLMLSRISPTSPAYRQRARFSVSCNCVLTAHFPSANSPTSPAYRFVRCAIVLAFAHLIAVFLSKPHVACVQASLLSFSESLLILLYTNHALRVDSPTSPAYRYIYCFALCFFFVLTICDASKPDLACLQVRDHRNVLAPLNTRILTACASPEQPHVAGI